MTPRNIPSGVAASHGDGDIPALAFCRNVMLEAVSISSLMSRSRYLGGGWHDTGRHWSREDSIGLLLVVRAKVDPKAAADSLGRSPTSLVHRAIDTGLKPPREWRDLVTKRVLNRGARELMQYPYVSNVRGEHADLLAVNALVSRGLPDHMRADVCQEIMLAIWQGETTIAELTNDRALVNRFVGKARRDNYECGGYALSLDVPMRDGRSWYEVLPECPL